MRLISPGHVYALDTFDGEVECIVSFMKREGLGYPGNVGAHPGTNMQEVLRMLIDRLGYLNGQVPCVENELLIAHARTMISLLEVRAAKRHGRVLDLAAFVLPIEQVPTCIYCGHIQCIQCHAATQENCPGYP